MHNKTNSALSIQYSVLCTRRVRNRGTALIETAIVLPVYMILLFGLLYFGYATLGRQRQDRATAYAAWQPNNQNAPPQATSLVSQFWSWNGPAAAPGAAGMPNSSAAIAGDTTFAVYGGSVNHQWVRPSDEYYNMTINGIVFIPSQVPYHSLSGGDNNLFDSERVTMDLWNYALGSITQSFNWTPTGIQQQMNENFTSFARYLNTAAKPRNGGLLNVPQATWDPISQSWIGASSPPTSIASVGQWPRNCGGMLAAAFNGPPGAGQWLQRSAVESTMNYQPPYLSWITRDNSQAVDSNVPQFLTSQNANPPPTTAAMDCDVTIRNPAVVRQGAEEGAANSAAFLSGAGQYIGRNGTLLAPNSMDNLSLNPNTGMTIQTAWTPW